MYDLPSDARTAIDGYTLSALRSMFHWRAPGRPEPRSKADGVTQLREKLFEPSSIRAAIASCDPLSIEALALLRRKGGAMPVAALCAQVASWHAALPPADAWRIPSELVRRALAFWHNAVPVYHPTLYDVHRPSGNDYYSTLIYSPPAILDLVSIPPNLGRLTLTAVGPATSDSPPSLVQRRVLSFLRAVEAHPPRVLRNGSIGARDRVNLSEATGLGPSDSHDGERWTNGLRSKTNPIDFLVHTLIAAGLLEIGPDRFLRPTPALPNFVVTTPQRQIRMLLTAWLESADNVVLSLAHLRFERRAGLSASIPDDARVRAACARLVEILKRDARPGYLYDVEDLSRTVRCDDVEFLVSWLDLTPHYWSTSFFRDDAPDAPVYAGIALEDSRGRPRALRMGADWELVEGAFIRAVLAGPLTWLGLVQVSEGASTRFGLTRLGALVFGLEDVAPDDTDDGGAIDHGSIVVQPNFDILVFDLEEHARLLYQIDRFAANVSVDRAAVFRLTRESVCAGLQLGQNIDDVLRLLDRAGREPIPQNVAFSLREWAADFESVRWVRSGTLLEAPDEVTLDAWLGDPEIAPHLDRRVGPTLALVRSSEPTALRRRLQAVGVDVDAVDANDPIEWCASVASEVAIAAEAQDVNLYSRAALDLIADECPSSQPGLTWVVSADSVHRANAHDLSATRILEILDRATGGRVPPGMRSRVRGWSGEVGPISLGSVAIFVAPDAETFRDLKAEPELARHFVEQLTSISALVRLDSLDVLRQALAARGIGTKEYRARET
jgi:hypothetical protein